MAESMWKIPTPTETRTPLSLMREQGGLLAQSTNGYVVGQASALGTGQDIRSDLSLVVPALNGYAYLALTLLQPVMTSYPAKLYAHVQGGKIYEVKSLDEFEGDLRQVLSSDEMAALISNLLVQASAIRGHNP